ncbi:ficolin-1-like [Armigeres subalbatus]|uniref:ficolin-1-like n=1 Tax=Armigeres subalbatus TaxID=124917 RepID=UPI002ED1C42D
MICDAKMSTIKLVFKTYLLVLSVITVASQQEFGYELLVAKLEALEDRFVKRDTALQIYESCDNVPSKISGVYNIQIGPQETKRIFCDQEYNGGGWAVIQRRFDGSVNFFRGWEEYKRGFGNMNDGEFWLGLDIIHQLTYSGHNELMVLLEDFEGNSTNAKLDKFEIAAQQEGYKATVAGMSGTAGDSILFINDRKFTTFDVDNDMHSSNCATMFHGAWWYTKCHSSNLNGKYLRGETTEYATGMVWKSFRGHHYALKSSRMMIRRKKPNK